MNGAEPTFTRDGTTSLYWADPADRIAAFLAEDSSSIGHTPSLTATWSVAGAYVFLGAAVHDSAAFLAALRSWLSTRPPGRRFLWVVNPGDPNASWSATELLVQAGTDSTWVVVGSDFQLADYALGVAAGSAVAPGASTDAGWGFQLADSTAAPAVTLRSTTDTLPARAGTSVLAMSTRATGAWRFVLDRPAGGGDAFAQLGCGMRYFTPGPDGFVRAVHFAVLRQPKRVDVTLFAQVDPLRPLDSGRSALGFFSWAGAGSTRALLSGYATAHGHGVILDPSGAGSPTPARLVFNFAPWFAGGSRAREVHDASVPMTPLVAPGYYFVPDGPFRLSVARSPGSARISPPPMGSTG